MIHSSAALLRLLYKDLSRSPFPTAVALLFCFEQLIQFLGSGRCVNPLVPSPRFPRFSKDTVTCIVLLNQLIIHYYNSLGSANFLPLSRLSPSSHISPFPASI
ncbi:hypothetical protein FPOAC2_03403 [Fusarium poae]